MSFIQLLWRLSKLLPLLLPSRDVGIIAGLILGIIYGTISGFSIPTQRSLAMLVMFSLVTIFRRHNQSWHAWLWSLFFVLLINPLTILTIGFWLSFSAVAAIIYTSSGRMQQNRSHLKKFWRMQLAITLALLPITLLFFQQVSLVAIIANLIAMPGVCLIVVPMSLLGTLALLIPENFGVWILWCSAKLLHIIWWWLTFLAHFFSCNWYHPIYNLWLLIATSIGVLLLLAPRGLPIRLMGLFWLIPLCFYTPPKPNLEGEVWFTLLDIGQGLAAVVQTKNHLLLYDTGQKFSTGDSGSSVIIPYLRQIGIKNIEMLVVSHGDSDHSGGADSILKLLPVAKILTSVPEKLVLGAASSCTDGQHWQWDRVDFHILSPPKNTSLTDNNASCILKITSGINSILLPGDIEKTAEDLLVKNHSRELPATILIAPHHGSATSSTVSLSKLVAPRYVLFPVGYKNRFRLPHKKILARYRGENARLLNTAQTGAITFKFNDKSAILNPGFYREQIRRFWHTE